MANNIETAEFNKDKRARVRLLQGYLREIASNDVRIPMLVIDGLFYQETADSVKAFQRINGLPQTGEVDEETWNEIYRQYVELVGIHRPCPNVGIFKNPDSNLELNSSGYTIYFAQVMLSRIHEKYYNIEKVDINGTVDEKTLTALNQIRKISGLDSATATDNQTLEALVIIYSSVVQK